MVTVHPRVGGETLFLGSSALIEVGPSPRGRGNREKSAQTVNRWGSIPAWAGKPSRRAAKPATSRVHPRVGGETQRRQRHDERRGGPSPRGRGNREGQRRRHCAGGSIPAWAGKPRAFDNTGDDDGVQSPRGRGNLALVLALVGLPRSIPAWAGKPRKTRSRCEGRRVHPRVGGETTDQIGAAAGITGPSPRGRGNRCSPRSSSITCGSIPAWAGKPLDDRSVICNIEVHPRVGGETYSQTVAKQRVLGPSPRGRGNR